MLLLGVALATTCYPDPVSSSGAYEDYGRVSSFLRARHVESLDFRLTRTGAAEHDATILLLSGCYPLKSRILLQAELTFTSRSNTAGIESDFGDGILRLRTRLYGGPGRALHLLGSLRTGSGAVSLFPYATGSVDVEGGFGWVDTLTALTVWASATATRVTRLNETLKSASAHGNFFAVAAGMVLALGQRFDLQLGAAGNFLTSGETREIYFSQFEYRATEAFQVFVLLQAEGGDRAWRAVDYAVGTGLWIAR